MTPPWANTSQRAKGWSFSKFQHWYIYTKIFFSETRDHFQLSKTKIMTIYLFFKKLENFKVYYNLQSRYQMSLNWFWKPEHRSFGEKAIEKWKQDIAGILKNFSSKNYSVYGKQLTFNHISNENCIKFYILFPYQYGFLIKIG